MVEPCLQAVCGECSSVRLAQVYPSVGSQEHQPEVVRRRASQRMKLYLEKDLACAATLDLEVAESVHLIPHSFTHRSIQNFLFDGAYFH